jgi:hypothetical protein
VKAPSPKLVSGFLLLGAAGVAVATGGTACVPPGNSTPSDAGPATVASITRDTERPSGPTMASVFEDTFDRGPDTTGASGDAATGTTSAAGNTSHRPLDLTDGALAEIDAGRHDRGLGIQDGGRALKYRLPDGAVVTRELPSPLNTDSEDGGESASEGANELGPDWSPSDPRAWHIEKGRLCGSHAKNHGVWLNRVLPPNARIEFDAIAETDEGDLKGEFWGDGHSFATSLSYTNATGYLAILGGWHNTFHVLARRNEHGTDRKEIKIDKTSDDPEEKPVEAGQMYRFKVERSDGKTVRFSVNGTEYLNYPDPEPLKGGGHDHFAFNDWDAKVCFDNVKVTPLP